MNNCFSPTKNLIINSFFFLLKFENLNSVQLVVLQKHGFLLIIIYC